MKKLISSTIILSALIYANACNSGSNDNSTDNADSTAQEVVILPPPVIPESETFYNLDSATAIVVANPITYDVEIKNYIPDDDWKEECLKYTNNEALINAIFQAVYKKRLTPFDYFKDEEMTIEDVKAAEKKYSRNQIGKIMFTEKWYFSESSLTFTKKVTSITFGYEIINPETKENQGFFPAFKVNLN